MTDIKDMSFEELEQFQKYHNDTFLSLLRKKNEIQSALLTCQAREAELREALKKISNLTPCTSEIEYIEIANEALSHSTGSKEDK